jgi:hypothetical protein
MYNNCIIISLLYSMGWHDIAIRSTLKENTKKEENSVYIYQ